MSTRAGYAGGPTPPGPAREASAAPPRLGSRPRAATLPETPGPRPAVHSPAAPPMHPARSRSSTVPTSKQRRQAAQRHLQKQLERRAELTKRRRRNLAILATAIGVVVVVIAALI